MPQFNANQLKQLSEFTSNLSLVFFASVITPFFGNIDKVELTSVVSGVILGFMYLTLSLSFLKEKKP